MTAALRARSEYRVPAEPDLTWFLCESDAASGVSSSFAPLVDIAQGGWGGAPDQERRITDRRFGRGGTVSRARALHAAFAALPATDRAVLRRAYGQRPWVQEADDAFGVGTGMRLQRVLGDLIGVAMVTPTALTGASTHGVAEGKRALQHGTFVIEGRWIVAQLAVRGGGSLGAVGREAMSMLGAALVRWWEVRR